MDTKLSEFCPKYEIFTGRVFRMTEIIAWDIWFYTQSEEKIILLCSMELVEFNGIRGCIWKAILEEKCL